MRLKSDFTGMLKNEASGCLYFEFWTFSIRPYFRRHITVSDSLARYHFRRRRRCKISPGHSYGGLVTSSLHGIVLGVINAVIRPVLLLLSLPFIIVTLGFLILIVNTLTFWLAGGLVPGFGVDGFWSAFFGSMVVSIVSWALSGFVRSPDGEIRALSQQDQIRSVREKRLEGRTIE